MATLHPMGTSATIHFDTILTKLSLSCHVAVVQSQRIQELLRSFMRDTIGQEEADLGNFAFGDHVETLVTDLIESIVIDAAAEIELSFGLDLNPVFNSSTDRIPNPFFEIKKFNLTGSVGINEWSTELDLAPFKFAITEAKAMVDVSATIPSPPISITSPIDFRGLFDSSTIDLSASLDVSLPVFIVASDSFGFGAKITYSDTDLLDNITQSPVITKDALIKIELIKTAAEKLKNVTSFIDDFEPFDTKIPLIKKSVNEIIAGNDRSLSEVFDLTDWANSLTGTEKGEVVTASLSSCAARF